MIFKILLAIYIVLVTISMCAYKRRNDLISVVVTGFALVTATILYVTM